MYDVSNNESVNADTADADIAPAGSGEQSGAEQASGGELNDAPAGSGEQPPAPGLRGYKTVCLKLGLSMCLFFGLRLAFDPLAVALYNMAVRTEMNPTLYAILFYTASIMLSYIIPIAFTILIFKYRAPARPPMRELYKKPRSMAKALGTFPATYGFGYGIALLTLLASMILRSVSDGDNYVEQLLRPATVRETTNIAELVMMMLLMVVAAPIFEEYWVRGIFFDALRPYGAGMAIIISSVLFGLMHGSLYMLFYTTAFGFALGYIRYATGSLLIVTILHALVNAVSATTLLFLSLVNMTAGQNRIINTIELIYIVVVLVLIIAGIAVFIAKIPTIRKYKFENPWKDVGPWKKFGYFAVSIPVIVSMALAFNEISGQWLMSLIRS